MVNLLTLDKLVTVLKENGIVCGIGGSYLLQLYSLYHEPQDVDFWVSPDDIQKLRKIFFGFQEIEEKIALPKQYHFKMRYYDIDVDFVACFIIKPNQNKYVYNIEPDSITIIETENGIKIPCTSLEDWYIVYKLLKRNDKANLIKEYLGKQKKVLSNQKLEKSLENNDNKLPHRLTKEIRKFIWENAQLNIFDLYNSEEEK